MSDYKPFPPLGYDLQQSLIYITRDAASKSDKAYTKEQNFDPHEWVKEAVDRAYRKGLADGREDLQKTLRSCLGV